MTFDGLRFDSQAVGEYVYAEKIDGTAGSRVVARLDYTGGEPSVFSPTSVIAVGIEYGDLDIELYTRPARDLLVNGEETELRPGVPTELAPGVIVTRTLSGGHTVSLPDMYVEYAGIDLSVTVDTVGGFGGMLGTNNGLAADDILIRDPALPPSEWERLTIAEASAQGERASQFAESWRLADPADSPLSLPFDRFDAISQFSLDTVALAPFRAQAASLLGGVAELCSGTDSPDSVAIDIFAIELAIGTEPDLLGCEFEVHGRVVTDAPTTPAIGAQVVVDAPGLTRCETVTGQRGGYSCTMRVDLDEAAALDIAFPLDVTIEVTGAGAAAPGATVTRRLDERVPLTERRYHGVDDIVLPIDQTVTVDLSGSLNALGAPFAAPTGLSARALDGAGRAVATVPFAVTPDGSGAYQALLALPLSTQQVEWTWRYGIDSADHPRSTTNGLVAGLNQATFDATYNPPVVELAGRALYNGAAPTSVDITLTATRPGASPFVQAFRVRPDSEGDYSVPVLIPVATTTVTTSARLGNVANPTVEASLASVVPGSNPLAFDIVQDAPVLNVFGTARINGNPAPATRFVARWAGGSAAATALVDPIDGSYAVDFDLPAGVTDATIEAFVGVVRADFPTREVTGIVDGPNPVEFIVESTPPVVQISGTASAGGVAIDENFNLDIESADGTFRRTIGVSVDAAGVFSTQLTLPVGTTTIDLTARIGRSVADWYTVTVDGLIPGLNLVPLNPTFDAVGLALSGVLKVNGTAQAGARFVRIVSFDAADGEIERFDVAVSVAGDGSYSEFVQVPANTRRIEVTALIGPYPTLRQPVSFVVAPVVANPIVYSTDAQPSTLRVSGTLTAGGQFLSGPVEFRTVFALTLPDGTPSTLSVLDTAIVDGLSGTYTFDRLVPELASSARVSALTSANPAENISVDVDPIPAGLVPVTLSGAPAIPVTIDFTGVLSEFDGPFVGTTDIRYVLREADGDVVADVTRTVTTDAFGQYRFHLETDSRGCRDVGRLARRRRR